MVRPGCAFVRVDCWVARVVVVARVARWLTTRCRADASYRRTRRTALISEVRWNEDRGASGGGVARTTHEDGRAAINITERTAKSHRQSHGQLTYVGEVGATLLPDR